MSAEPDVAELRREIEDLRRRIDELETRLETRMSAIELKEATDLEVVRAEISKLRAEIASLRGGLGTVESLQRSNHMAQVHLWGVTARYLKVAEEEIRSAQKQAEETMHIGR